MDVFFKAETFDNYWGEDDYKKSHIKILKTGEVLFYQNLGLNLRIFDEHDNQYEHLTILLKLQAKLSIRDLTRLTLTESLPKPDLRFTELRIFDFSIYNQD